MENREIENQKAAVDCLCLLSMNVQFARFCLFFSVHHMNCASVCVH